MGIEHRWFAVATLDAVLVYDTHHLKPIAAMENIHYAQITDIAWSGDGKTLACSSADGYCTLASFADGELGVEIAKENLLCFWGTLPQELLDIPKATGNGSAQQPAAAAPTSSAAKSTPRRITPTFVSAASDADPAAAAVGLPIATKKKATRRVATTLVSATS